MSELAIHTTGLGKRFGDRVALESIDLEVPRGCAFGFLGPNGAGKTTLIRLLLGLAHPTSGSIELLGHKDRAKALARVGAIIEEPRFHRHLTGRENLHIHAAARDKSAHGRVDAAIERVGLARRADDKVGGYSLGMRQRLGVARCLVGDPELLILDEPVNGLDPAGILEFRNLIRDLVGEGRTVLLSSHLLDEVEKTCDVAAVKAVAAGDAVLSAPVTRRLLDQVAHRLPAPVERDDGQLAVLTERELEVLRLLAGGRSNAEIAAALVVSEATVKSHVSNLLGKLELRDRVQAVILAYETGLVGPR